MIGSKAQILEWLKTISDDKIIKSEVINETRSWQQNRLYHKWLTDIVWEFEKKWIFITSEDLHEGLRDKLIKWKYQRNLFTWKRKLHRKSTTELSKKDFWSYIKDIEKYLWQTYEISHPLPTDLWYNKK